MKIAIAAGSKDADGEVSPISGRAEYYHIFEDGKFVKTIPNPFKMGGGGAGPAVVQMLHNEGVEKVISGKFGEKMIEAMEEKGMKHEVATGKIQEAIR